jgi:hypothetical protein
MTDDALRHSVEAAIARLHSAMAAVANGDVAPIKALYSHTSDATSFYGWGGYEKGWDAVSTRWTWAGRQFKGGGVRYQNLTTIVTPELFYTTDIETFSMDGVADHDGPTTWSNRVTHIFRLENDEWRLLHRHGNRLEEQFAPGPRMTERKAGT